VTTGTVVNDVIEILSGLKGDEPRHQTGAGLSTTRIRSPSSTSRRPEIRSVPP